MKLTCKEIIPGVYPSPDKNRLFSTAVTAVALGGIPAGTVVAVKFQRYDRDAVSGEDRPIYFLSGLDVPVWGSCLKEFVI